MGEGQSFFFSPLNPPVVGDFEVAPTFRENPRQKGYAPLPLLLPLVFLEDKAGVLAAETEAIGECCPHFFLSGHIGHVIQVAVGVGKLVVYGGVDYALCYRLDACYGFHSS
jgi:hypothetical protein